MSYTEEELDTVVTVRQIRDVGACVSGQMGWFKARGMPWKTILREGVKLREIHDRRDGDAEQVVQRLVARMREPSRG